MASPSALCPGRILPDLLTAILTTPIINGTSVPPASVAREAGEARYPGAFSISNAYLGLLLASCCLGVPAKADEPAGDKRSPEETVDGLFVTVPSPIDTLGVNRVKAITNRFLDRADHR